MQTFFDWLPASDIWLIETYYSFDPSQYNRLFDDELKKLRASTPSHQQAITGMQGFDWVGYIARSVRNAGYRDQRQVQEVTHDIAVRLLTAGLFKNYDERRHGPFDLRFKRSVSNAVKNLAEKDRNRHRLIPTVSIGQEFQPGGIKTDDLPDRISPETDEKVIDDFRKLVGQRLGQLGLAVFDARLNGQEMKSLIGRPDLGSPGRFTVKSTVQQIKALAREYAELIADPAFLRDVYRAMDREAETVRKRVRTTTGKR